jgi:hypothetical protein
VEGNGSYQGHTVYITEMDFAAEEEEGTVEQGEDYGTCKIGVIHNMLVDACQWVENC